MKGALKFTNRKHCTIASSLTIYITRLKIGNTKYSSFVLMFRNI